MPIWTVFWGSRGKIIKSGPPGLRTGSPVRLERVGVGRPGRRIFRPRRTGSGRHRAPLRPNGPLEPRAPPPVRAAGHRRRHSRKGRRAAGRRGRGAALSGCVPEPPVRSWAALPERPAGWRNRPTPRGGNGGSMSTSRPSGAGPPSRLTAIRPIQARQGRRIAAASPAASRPRSPVRSAGRRRRPGSPPGRRSARAGGRRTR